MPDNAPPRRSNYIDRDTLRALVLAYRDAGTVSDELARTLLAIAAGVWDRYRFTADKDDFVQDVVLHLLGRPLEKADAQKHLFNFFTTCAIRFGMKLREKAQGDQRRFNTYAAELVESGRPLPHKTDGMDRAEWSDEMDPKGHIESDSGGGVAGRDRRG